MAEVTAMREKHWSELDSEQKVERMRGVVKMQQQLINHIERFTELFKRHGHRECDVVVSLDEPGVVGHARMPVDSDDAYF